MSAYMIVITRVISAEGWAPYQSQVVDCIAAHGGVYVVRRATPEVLEGGFGADRMTIFRFPSMEAIRAFWNSDDYANRIRPLRDGLGLLDVLAVPGDDTASKE